MIGRLIKLCISLGVSLADSVLRQASRLMARPPAAVRVVLYYHAVPPQKRGSFGRQMDELLRIAAPVRADGEELLNPGYRYAAVTFDDGFVSVIENALPELRSRHIPCTIFVPTGSLGTRPSWIGRGHPDGGETVASPEQLRALSAEDLVTIGSHSVTHPDFRGLDDRAARVELEQSKLDLESILKKKVDLFSFPHGAFNLRSLDLARQAGYTRVFSIDPAVSDACRSQFACGRVRVDPDEWMMEFRLKTEGAYRWLSRASAWKRRLEGFHRDDRRVLHEPTHGA